MATFTALPDSDARALVDAYGLGTLRRVIPIPEGSVNSNFRLEVEHARTVSSFFLRVFEEQGVEGAEYDARLLTHLAKRGVPAPRPLVATDGRTVATAAGKPASLFPFVPGSSSCQRSVDIARAEALGRALAQIHVAARDFPIRRAGRFRIEDLHARMPRIAAASDPSIARMADELPRALESWGARRRSDVPTGVVHGDLFRDNVLWASQSGDDHATIVALLDFESASDGRFVYDVAVTVLAWSYGDDFSEPIARAIVSGYESVRPLEPVEREALRAELAIAALRFTTTRITDYALRSGVGARVVKDWRRFWSRFQAVETIAPFW